jgi:hypothetical protein
MNIHPDEMRVGYSASKFSGELGLAGRLIRRSRLPLDAD